LANVITILSIITVGQGDMVVSGEIALSGSYVAGGEVLDFTKAIADPEFQGMLPYIVSAYPPKQFDAWSQGGNIANGYFPVIGTLLTNCKLKIVSSFGGELVAGAYPAAITGDDIAFSLLCAKL
jgi:hypothetical protein